MNIFCLSVMLDLSFVASVGQGYLAVPISSPQLMQKKRGGQNSCKYLPWLYDKKNIYCVKKVRMLFESTYFNKLYYSLKTKNKHKIIS